MITDTIQNLKIQLAEAQGRRLELQIEFNDAAELGDAPENFPLDAARHALHTNEELITQLESQIAALQSGETIDASEFSIQDNSGQQMRVIVTAEAVTVKPGIKLVSPESPLGAALLQTRGVGEFKYTLPNGTAKQMYRLA